MLERAGRLPDVVVACVGGGSNAIGMLHPFVEDEGVGTAAHARHYHVRKPSGAFQHLGPGQMCIRDRNNI